MSQIVKTRLTKTMNKHMKFVNLELFSKLIIDFFCFKDFVPESLRSSLIYKFSCGSYTVISPTLVIPKDTSK